MTAVAFEKKSRATFEGQSSNRIAKTNGLTKAIVLLVEIVVILKQLKDEMSGFWMGCDFSISRWKN